MRSDWVAAMVFKFSSGPSRVHPGTVGRADVGSAAEADVGEVNQKSLPLSGQGMQERCLAEGCSKEDALRLTEALKRIAPGGDLENCRDEHALRPLLDLEKAMLGSVALPHDALHVLDHLPPIKPLSQQIDVPPVLTEHVLAYTEKHLREESSRDPTLVQRYPVLNLSYKELSDRCKGPVHAYHKTVDALLGCLRRTLSSHAGRIDGEIRAHYAPGGTLETYLKSDGVRRDPNAVTLLQTFQAYLCELHAYLASIEAGRHDRFVTALQKFPATAESANLACAGGAQENISSAIDVLRPPVDRLTRPVPVKEWIKEFIARRDLIRRVYEGAQIHLPTALLVALGVPVELAREIDAAYQYGYDVLPAEDVYAATIELPLAVSKALRDELDAGYASFKACAEAYDCSVYEGRDQAQALTALLSHPLMPSPIPDDCYRTSENDEEAIDIRRLCQTVKRSLAERLAESYASTRSTQGTIQSVQSAQSGNEEFTFISAFTDAGQESLCHALVSGAPDRVDNALTLLWALGQFPAKGQLVFFDLLDRLQQKFSVNSIDTLAVKLKTRFPLPHQQARIDEICQVYRRQLTPGFTELRQLISPSALQGAPSGHHPSLTEADLSELIVRRMSLAQWRQLLTHMPHGERYRITDEAVSGLIAHPQFNEILAIARGCLDFTDAQNSFDDRFFAELAERGDALAIRRLCQLGIAPYRTDSRLVATMASGAARNGGHVDVVNALQDAGVNFGRFLGPNKIGWDAARIAAEHGRVEFIAALQKAGLSLNEKDRQELALVAVCQRHSAVVQMMLESRTNLNEKSVVHGSYRTTLGDDLARKAMRYSAPAEFLVMLQEKGWKPDPITIRELAEAAVEKGHVAFLEVLRDKFDLNLNHLDIYDLSFGDHLALPAQRDLQAVRVIEFLHRSGVRLGEIKDKDRFFEGSTLAHKMAMDNLPKAMAALFEAGVKVDQANAQGETPAHIAAGHGSTAVVRTLGKLGGLENLRVDAANFYLDSSDVKDAGKKALLLALYAWGVKFDNAALMRYAPELKSWEKRLLLCVRSLKEVPGGTINEASVRQAAKASGLQTLIDDPAIRADLRSRLSSVDHLQYVSSASRTRQILAGQSAPRTVTLGVPEHVKTALLTYLDSLDRPESSFDLLESDA